MDANMDVDSRIYDQLNRSQQRDGRELMERIIDDNPKSDFDIILDIGCGSGNVTQELARSIPHGKIVAFDCLPRMVEYAKKNHQEASITYLAENISRPWQQLDPAIRDLEGRVSLAFANRVLHWIADRQTALANIVRLMRPGGLFYANVTAFRDFNANLPDDERLENEKLFKVPSQEKQFEMWRGLVRDAGLRELDAEFINKRYPFPKTQVPQILFTPTANKYKVLLATISDKPKEERNEIVTHFRDLILRTALSSASDQKPIASIDDFRFPYASKEYLALIDYEQFRLVARK